ncbi:pecanex-like protein 2 [Striga asiatica]|uniref:Pecanex-like protein 2 n=1 Tax=Striga asiatica TaxID=4170 RepID=A0A5A7PM85_STRAF|nr:pecanex-like protein 2 [Striga asiatica]
MGPQAILLLLLIRIVQCRARIRNITRLLNLSPQLPQFPVYSLTLRMRLVPCPKRAHSILHLYAGFFLTFTLSIFTLTPSTSCHLPEPAHTFEYSTYAESSAGFASRSFRAAFFPSSKFPCVLHEDNKVRQMKSFGGTGISSIKTSASENLPERLSKSTMHTQCSIAGGTPNSVFIERKYSRPSSTSPPWLHADRSETKVTWSGFGPQSAISRKVSRAFRKFPCLASADISIFQESRERVFGSGSSLRRSSSSPHFPYMSMAALETK